MRVFISHNEKDKETARLLALALVDQGIGVWFDEWSIKPGDSIVGGIELGVSSSNVFVLVWSKAAAESNWVGSEMRAYIHRRIQNHSLRVIPIMLDETPLPILVADYKGFKMRTSAELGKVASEDLK